MKELIAVSTNDLKNISNGAFGKSHFFEIYSISDGAFENTETRENVLFMQSCELQGRIEHLHGLLGDIKIFVGNHFLDDLRGELQAYGHQLIPVRHGKIEDVLNEVKEKILSELHTTEI
jgi:predicted Fe-Mo cluster-binding NifX family protein